MPEYDDLIKRLRNRRICVQQLGTLNDYPLLGEAADVIEFLQTYKVCFDNIVRMGGWWLVGQDKNLYRMNVPMNWPPKGTKTVELFPLPEPPKEE